MLVALMLALPMWAWDMYKKGHGRALTSGESTLSLIFMGVTLVALGVWIVAMRHTPSKSLHFWIELLLVPAVILWWAFNTQWIVG